MLAERQSIFTAKNRNVSFVNPGLTVLLLVSAVLACSSGSSKTCSATLTLDGQTFVGQETLTRRRASPATSIASRQTRATKLSIALGWIRPQEKLRSVHRSKKRSTRTRN